MAALSLSTIDAAVATRVAAQLSGFSESPSASSLMRTPSSIVDKAFVLIISSGASLDGTMRGLRQKTLTRIEVPLTVEFARKLNRSQPATRRAAQDNMQDIITALLDVSWTSTIGAGGARFMFKSFNFSFALDGQAIIGQVNFNVSFESSLT